MRSPVALPVASDGALCLASARQTRRTSSEFALTPDGAAAVYREAVALAKKAGLPWVEDEILLTPSPQLGDLVRRSQELAASQGEQAEGGE